MNLYCIRTQFLRFTDAPMPASKLRLNALCTQDMSKYAFPHRLGENHMVSDRGPNSPAPISGHNPTLCSHISVSSISSVFVKLQPVNWENSITLRYRYRSVTIIQPSCRLSRTEVR